MGTKRLFVGVKPAAETVALLAQLQHAVLDAGHRNAVRWLPEENLHVTLHFLGATDETLIKPLARELSRAAQEAVPFSTRVYGTGCFPNPSRPRVFWAGLDSKTQWNALYERTGAAIASLGLPVETRAYRPHITLGYARKQAARPEVQAVLPALAAAAGTEPFTEKSAFRVDSVILFESVLSPAGARHYELHKACLSDQQHQ